MRASGELAADRWRTEYKIFTYEGLVTRTEIEIAWGRHGLKLIDSLEKVHGP